MWPLISQSDNTNNPLTMLITNLIAKGAAVNCVPRLSVTSYIMYTWLVRSETSKKDNWYTNYREFLICAYPSKNSYLLKTNIYCNIQPMYQITSTVQKIVNTSFPIFVLPSV